ncbi:MAG: 30S ribosomal protein S2 [SAR86 cluster bacterium]|uniref:Small ribosomal subunit protein uS2 n=1 Tax=SAR86 cluster bacterium TaxID=2030880 RepID=A0A520MY53_9GAMM|nr:MAG: 30S ribosomal protein S2 [SAR86 cluster bacterium]
MSKTKVTIEQLFEMGAHFGHRKRFWNPHMADYIFCEKNNIHIINLYKTQEKILELYDTFKNFSSFGNKIMIVGTKRVASEYVKSFGEKTGMPYISHRWLGGMLTNWKTIKVPINKLLEYEENKSTGQLEGMIKKEAVMLEKEMKKLALNFDGVKEMKGLPDALFVIDVENENIAVQEALKMGIPVFGLVDTNSNPTNLSNFIPVNDDSSKTIKFIMDLLSEAILEGQDSARKQGLVQKLDGDKGPKVFSLNTASNKVSVQVENAEETDKKDADAVIEVEEENVEPAKDSKTSSMLSKTLGTAAAKKPATKKAAAAKKPATKKAAAAKKPATKKAAVAKKPATKKAAVAKKPATKKAAAKKSSEE